MADITLDVEGQPNTPATGAAVIYVDTVSKRLYVKDDAGLVKSALHTNFSTTPQTPSATVRTYLVGSALPILSSKLQIGSSFRWKFNMTKTGAGTATSTIDIAIGTLGTTGDAAIVSFTKPAGTAVIDEAFVEIQMVCRGPLSASGILAGEFTLIHNLSATGHAQIPCVVVSTVSSAFDVTAANLIAGLCITTGTADAITIQTVQSEYLV